MNTFTLYHGNVLDMLRLIPADSVDVICTSPPYWNLRSYKTDPILWDVPYLDSEQKVVACSAVMEKGKHDWQEHVEPARGGSGENSIVGANRDTEANNRGHPTVSEFCTKCKAFKGSLGNEPTADLYLTHLMSITAELKRILSPTGSLWWNIGETVGSDKSMMLIPERFALAMVNQGWILRAKLQWLKGNALPSSKKDSLTSTYEPVYFFVKSNETQYWTNAAIGKATDTKPLGINGIGGIDWEWKDYPTKEGMQKKKRTLWWGWDYYFDLNAIRQEKRYPSQRMKDACEEIYWKAKEMRNQNKLLSYNGKISLQNAELYSSPHARELRSGSGSIQEFSVAFRTMTKAYIEDHHELTQKEVDFLNGFSHLQFGSIEGGNPGDVLRLNLEPLSEQHVAPFPTALPRFCLNASCPDEVCSKCGKPKVILIPKVKGGIPKEIPTCNCGMPFRPAVVLDPFIGSGTTAVVAMERNLDVIGIELSKEYCHIVERRTNIKQKQMLGAYRYNLVEQNTKQSYASVNKDC